MRPWRLFSAACLGAFLLGCAGPAIRPVTRAGDADPVPLAAALERFEGPPTAARAVGRAWLPDGRRVDFAAGSAPEKGFRLDAVAGPFAKLLFSATCKSGGGCEIYLPDRNLLIKQPEDGAASWFGALLSGRPPRVGAPREAWTDGEGNRVLRLEDGKGRWQTVVFDGRGELPGRVLYGNAGRPPELELRYLEFRKDGDAWYPLRVTIGGADEAERLTVLFERIERFDSSAAPEYGIRVPPGTAEERGEGIETWKRMGFIWTPTP